LCLFYQALGRKRRVGSENGELELESLRNTGLDHRPWIQKINNTHSNCVFFFREGSRKPSKNLMFYVMLS